MSLEADLRPDPPEEESKPKPGHPPVTPARVGCALLLVFLLLGAGLYFRHRARLSVRSRGDIQEVVGALRSIWNGQNTFSQQDLDGDGTQNYGTLTELQQVGLIDSRLGRGRWLNYTFECHPGPDPEAEWFATADPIDPSAPGSRWLYIDQDLELYYSELGPIQGPLNRSRPPAGVFLLLDGY